MTVVTDREVTLTFQAQVSTAGGWVDLPVTNIIPSMDRDRVPYADARIEFEGLSYDLFLQLDPRIGDVAVNGNGNRVRFRIREYDADGAFRANLVRDSVFPELQWAELIIVDVDYDEVTGDGTILAGNRETVLEDRIRLSGSNVDTGASTVYSLVTWSLLDCFSAFVLSSGPVPAATSIPAGDRRLFLPGESHSQLLEPELQAIGYRLYDYWGIGWVLQEREETPQLGFDWGYTRTLQLASYTQREGAPPNADPIVYEVRHRLSRAGDYADGVLIKYDTLESGGSVTYQRSGDGSNSKGRVLTWRRAAPATNAANEIVKRTRIRGEDIIITARARLDVSPGQVLNVFMREDRMLTAKVRAVTWDIAQAEMTIRAQAGRPEE